MEPNHPARSSARPHLLIWMMLYRTHPNTEAVEAAVIIITAAAE